MEQEILKLIAQYQTIICLRHQNPDGDAIGSAMGLAYFIRENYPKKTVFVDGTEEPSFLNFLGTHDNANSRDYQNALVIVLDTANRERIDSNYFQKAKYVIKIDHHPNLDEYGDLNWVEPDRIATCEMVADLILNSNLKIPHQSLACLFTGLITDSNRFLHPGTSEHTLTVGAKLLALGVDYTKIYNQLYTESLDLYKFKTYLMSKMKVYKDEIGYIKLKARVAKRFHITLDVARQMVNVMANIEGISIWILLTENPKDNNVKVSLRSRNVIINQVAQKYNGGGHKFASGATLKNWKMLKYLLKDLKLILEDGGNE